MSVSLTVVATGWTGAELRVGEGNSVHTTSCAALITTALRPLRLVFSSSLLSLFAGLLAHSFVSGSWTSRLPRGIPFEPFLLSLSSNPR